MGNFVLKIDENLRVTEKNFGAYKKGDIIFVPPELFKFTTQYTVSDNPIDLAGYMCEYLISIAVLLNVHSSTARKKVKEFVDFLEENGLDVSSLRDLEDPKKERRGSYGVPFGINVKK